MACFRIPVGICVDIEKACNRFWWGDSADGKKLHWEKWERLCEPKTKGGLGFRRLVPFNQALLAKQVWRLIKNPDSLLARVLKQRYFRDGDIMQAEISSNCSFVWRSICWGRELLDKGLRWKVGNGASISVRKDRWIPGRGVWPGSSDSNGGKNILVSDFILESKMWNKEKLMTTYPHFIMEVICSIEVPKVFKEDARFWEFDEKGRFTVKSGYLCATNFYFPHASSSSLAISKWWKIFWAVHIPPKVLHFMWRALHDLIAMNQNLASHHVLTSTICFWCKRDCGSTLHGLIWCDVVRSAWKETVFWELLRKFKHLVLFDICRIVYDEKGEVGLDKWFFFLWFSWKFLCNIKHSNSSTNDKLDFRVGERMLDSFQNARHQVTIEHSLLPREGSRLSSPPPSGVIRLDVDVAVREEGVRRGVGFIARNSKGQPVFAGCQTISYATTTLMGELHAILLGVGFCLANDTGPVVVYSDSLLAIHVLSNKHQGCESLCDDLCEAFAHREHVVVDFLHMRREANRATHELARHSFSFSDVMIWKADFSNWLLDFVILDVD